MKNLLRVNQLLGNTYFEANDYVIEKQLSRARQGSEVPFEKAVDAFQDYLDTLDAKNEADYLDRKYAAIVGDTSAKQYFMQRLHDFLRENPQYQNTSFPVYYPNLAEAIFQHHLGFGPMSLWFAHPTESAIVNGTQISFGIHGQNTKVLQPFAFDSIDQVKKLIRTLTLQDAKNQVNQVNNWTQVDMLDGTRVTIFAPPLSETYVLIFRQFVFSQFTFEHLAQVQTVSTDSVMWWKQMSRLMLSIMTTGIRKSGKTTLLKVIYGARDPNYDVVSVERGTFEAHLRRDFPERANHIIALKSTIEDMNSLFLAFLRTDAHYIIIPEIRSMEVDLAIHSRERGNGWIGSYHGQYVQNIPLELANLSLEMQPNRNYHSAYIRAAQSIDVVITMWEDPQGRKIVTGVFAYEYNHEQETFYVVPWMRYNRVTDDWTYSHQIPPQMKQRLQDTVPTTLQEFMQEFEQLEKLHPMGKEQSRTQTIKIGG